MNYIWNAYPTATWVVSLVILLLLGGVAIAVVAFTVKRKMPLIVLIVLLIVGFITFLLNLIYVYVSIIAVIICYLLLISFVNLGLFRALFANPFKVAKAGNSKFVLEKAYDKDTMYKTIDNAVQSFSKSRTGAIITFEKNTPLTDVIKNGVEINAPVSFELLETIFYPGTRLHDGAVVIHKGTIVAASVFYTPTTKAFAGKYGSRHRAALGISEISDAVTIVVSEETGRISIAMNGELETVEPSRFLRVFQNYMEANKEI